MPQQRVGRERDLGRPDHLAQMDQAAGDILGRREIDLPVIAPGEHVHRAPLRHEARRPGHPDRGRGLLELVAPWISSHGVPARPPHREELHSPLQEFKEVSLKRCPMPFLDIL
jgi:hypothetical protein